MVKHTRNPVVAGVDIGSLSAKAVIMENGRMVSSATMLTQADSVKTAQEVMQTALGGCSLGLDEIRCVVSTGYGRVNVPFAFKNITEISCHAMGNWWLFRDVRTILDMGGQDCKAIRCSENGSVTNFAMNEKCAAGTGRYLERIARLLDIPLDEIGGRSLQPVEGPATINSTCTLFAEFDIVKLLRQGKHANDILAGASDSLTKRIIPLLEQVGVVPAFAISGGIAKNIGIVKRLEEKLGLKAYIAPDPQIVGALGAAIFATTIAKAQ
jgi:predicted CoA-substrate-specific enzyme activase